MSLLSEHGITFDGTHSYAYGLISTGIQIVNPPEPRLNLVDVKGYSGKLDYTNVLSDEIFYGNSTGEWEFITFDDYETVYQKVYSALHGKRTNVILDDDPGIQYSARLTVSSVESDGRESKIVIGYNCDPEKHSTAGIITNSVEGSPNNGVTDSKDVDWLWDELFDNTIYYGKFTVDGTKARNLINPNKKNVKPIINCTAEMLLTVGTYEYELVVGDNQPIILYPGSNPMTFEGTGDVTVSYDLAVV